MAANLHAQGDLHAALDAYQEIVRLTPQDPFLHWKLGELFRDLEDYHSAIVAYREALRLRPSYYQVHYALGYLLKDLGQLQEAAGHLREFLRFAPKARVYQDRARRVKEDLQNLDPSP